MRGFAPTELPPLRHHVHTSVMVADDGKADGNVGAESADPQLPVRGVRVRTSTRSSQPGPGGGGAAVWPSTRTATAPTAIPVVTSTPRG